MSKKLILCLVVFFLSFGVANVQANQPTRQEGTGTYETSDGGQYVTIGYSLMFGGGTTSIASGDPAYISHTMTSTPDFGDEFIVVPMGGTERRARGSVYVLTAAGKYEWYNYDLLVTPRNWNGVTLVVGRSLVDNLLLEVSGDDRVKLRNTLAKGGTAWINAINSGKSASLSHSVMSTGKLWRDGKSNYTAPDRTYSSSNIRDAFTWTSFTKEVLKVYYDNMFTFPSIPEPDNNLPVFNSLNVEGEAYKNGEDYYFQPNKDIGIRIVATDAGVGIKNIYARLNNNSHTDFRMRHDITGSTNHLHAWFANDFGFGNLHTSSASRVSYNTSTGRGEVLFRTRANADVKNHAFSVRYFLVDNNGNQPSDYVISDKTVRIDGNPPRMESGITSITGANFTSGNNYWIRPGTQVKYTIEAYENRGNDSGIHNIHTRLFDNGTDARSGYNTQNADGVTSWETWHSFNYNSGRIVSRTGNERIRTEVTATAKTGITNVRTHRLQYWVKDLVGNDDGYTDTGLTLNIDGTSPTIAASPINRGWANTDASVSLTVSDTGSGVKRHRVNWNASATTPGTWGSWNNSASSTTTENREGVWYLHVNAEDNVGNATTATFGPYQVDKTAPVCSPSIPYTDWVNTDLSVEITCTDVGSGFRRASMFSSSDPDPASVTFTGGNTTNPRTFTFSTDGVRYIHVRSEDQVGNFTTQTFGPYRVDKTKPQHTSHGIAGSRYENGNDYWIRPNDSVDIWLRGADNHSLLERIELQMNGSGQDLRGRHWFDRGNSNYQEYRSSAHIEVASATKTYESDDQKTREVTFATTAKTHGHNYHVLANYQDVAGNDSGWLNTNMRLRIDGEAPTISVEPFNGTGGFWSDLGTVTFNFTDPDSGVKEYRYRVSSNNGTSWSSFTGWTKGDTVNYDFPNNGRYRFEIEVRDNVGNLRSMTTMTYLIDHSPNVDFTLPQACYNTMVVIPGNVVSLSEVISYQWEVNGEEVSNGKDLYLYIGDDQDYEITLTASNSIGTNSKTKTLSLSPDCGDPFENDPILPLQPPFCTVPEFVYEMDFKVTRLDAETVQVGSTVTTPIQVERVSFSEQRDEKLIEKYISLSIARNELLALQIALQESKPNSALRDQLELQILGKQREVSCWEYKVTRLQMLESYYDVVYPNLELHHNLTKVGEILNLSYDGRVGLREGETRIVTIQWNSIGDGVLRAEINPPNRKYVTNDLVKKVNLDNNVMSTPIYVPTNEIAACIENGPVDLSGIIRVVCIELENGMRSCTEYKEYLSATFYSEGELTILPRVLRAGYGFDFEYTTDYRFDSWPELVASPHLVEQLKGPTLVQGSFPTVIDYISTNTVLLDKTTDSPEVEHWILPKFYVERFSGNVFIPTEYNSHPYRDISDNLVEGEIRKWFTSFEEKDGDYAFKVETSKTGVNQMKLCLNGKVTVSGQALGDPVVVDDNPIASVQTDFFRRSIYPFNPFPDKNVGFNWRGNTQKIVDLQSWYLSNDFVEPELVTDYRYRYRLSPCSIEKLKNAGSMTFSPKPEGNTINDLFCD